MSFQGSDIAEGRGAVVPLLSSSPSFRSPSCQVGTSHRLVVTGFDIVHIVVVIISLLQRFRPRSVGGRGGGRMRADVLARPVLAAAGDRPLTRVLSVLEKEGKEEE